VVDDPSKGGCPGLFLLRYLTGSRFVFLNRSIVPPVMKVLVIEDNADIAANIGDYLSDRGHIVDFAADGVTGLHLAVVNEFDVIVLDLMLPGIDGIEVCRRLRADARRQTPVLMLTARDSLEHKPALRPAPTTT
jgi:CheY-like chemotaxis protein